MTDIINESIALALEARADYLSREDVFWVDHAPTRPGESCAAVDFDATYDSQMRPVFTMNALAYLSDRVGSVPFWNDTKDNRWEVIDGLRRVAKEIRNEH